MKIGRNALCPCGSGKKYKKCCMKREPDHHHYVQHKINQAHPQIIEALLRYASIIYGNEALMVGESEYLGWPPDEDTFDRLADIHSEAFLPWFLFKWRKKEDDEFDLPGPIDQTVAEAVLQASSIKKLEPLEREYLEAMASTPFSLYEVIETTPGESLKLRDLFLGAEYLVLEKSASEIAVKGDIIYALVVPISGIHLLGAIGSRTLPPAAKATIRELLDDMTDEADGELNSEILEDFDFDIRALYMDLVEMQDRPPAMSNTDGEALAFNSLRYKISSPQKVFDALKDLTNGFASEKELLEEAEFDRRNKELRKVEIPWIVPANQAGTVMTNTVLGHIIIDGNKMRCEVNSDQRAERLRSLISERLAPEDAAYVTMVTESWEAKMENALPVEGGPDNEELINSPEVQKIMDDMMNKHWTAWLDMEIPALDGKTPRQAVEDETGREKVLALLENFEHYDRQREQVGDAPMNKYYQMLRRELGL